MTSAERVDAAIAAIESKSIRAWATENREVWVNFEPLFEYPHARDEAGKVEALTTYIICTALG